MRMLTCSVLLCLVVLTGCPRTEKEDLANEIETLKVQIQTAKEVESLKVVRDSLLVELNNITTRPEAAPITSSE